MGFLINSNSQDGISEIFHLAGDQTRFHPAIRIVAEEYERAHKAKVPMDFGMCHPDHIRDACIEYAKDHPRDNMKLSMRTLTDILDFQDESTFWWLPQEEDVEITEGETGE